METNNKPNDSFTIDAITLNARRIATPAHTTQRFWRGEEADGRHAYDTHEDGTFITTRGHRYRAVIFRDERGGHQLAYLRERKGLKARVDALKDATGYLTLASWTTLKNSDDYITVSATHKPATVTYTANIARRWMEHVGVAWIGAAAPREAEPDYDELLGTATMRVQMTRYFSPVKSEKTPNRIVLDTTYLGSWRMPGFTDAWHSNNNTHIAYVWLNADGTTAFWGHNLRDHTWDEGKATSAWLSQCQREYVLCEEQVREENGVRKDTQWRRRTPWMSVADVLSTKAGAMRDVEIVEGDAPDLPDGYTWLAHNYQGRRAFKEALAMAVFAPARVERMMETYGEDWMECV